RRFAREFAPGSPYAGVMDFEPEFDRKYRTQVHTHGEAGLIPGLILVGIGAMFFLNNLHIIYVREWIAYWPVILIALGLVKLVDSNFTNGRVAGGVLMGVGVVLLAQTLGYLQLRMRDMWPLILIGLGLLLLFKRAQWYFHLDTSRFRPGFRTNSLNTVNSA